jgi:hypothetical protein
MGKLRNPRRERFALEVASMVPVDRAYIAAGYRSAVQWARPNGSKLAHVPEVAARIDELRSEFAANCALSVEYLQALLLPAATANVLDFFEEDTNRSGRARMKQLSALTREQGAAIASVKFGDDGNVAELKFHPKASAVDTLMRSVGAIREAAGQTDVHVHVGERVASALNSLGFDESKALLTMLEILHEGGERDDTDQSQADPSGESR